MAFFSTLLKMLASVLEIMRWRARNESIRLLAQTSQDLYAAKIELYSAEDSGITGAKLDLCRMRVAELFKQSQQIREAEAAHNAIDLQPGSGPTNPSK